MLQMSPYTKQFRLRKVGSPGFELSMPIEIKDTRQKEMDPQSQTLETPQQKPVKKVLILEEDTMSCLLLDFILSYHFIPFELYRDIEQVRQALQNNSYALLIAGLNDPIGAASPIHLTKNPIPAIAITISSDKNELDTCLQAGYKHVLTKPYSEEELIKLIETTMENNPYENGNPEKTELLNVKPKSFSLEQLQRISNNDEEFILKMLEKFELSVKECSEQLALALPEDNWSRMKTVAHKSIPSYSLMGLDKMVSQLEFIERQAGLSPHNPEVQELVKKINDNNNEILRDINNYISYLKRNRIT